MNRKMKLNENSKTALKQFAVAVAVCAIASTAFGAGGLDSGLSSFKDTLDNLRKWFYILFVPIAILVMAVKISSFLQHDIDWKNLLISFCIIVFVGAVPIAVPWALGLFGAV